MTLASLRSWKTTVAGILSAVGLVAQAVLEISDAPAKLGMIAAIVNAVTLAALGILARDNTKTSEDVGAPGAAKAPPATPADAVKAAVEAIPAADVSVIAAAVQEALKAGQAARAAEEPRDRPTSPEEPR